MITNEFHTSNRQKIIESLQGGLIVLSAYALMQRGNDAAHRFEQEANFWWLTGINDPDWKLIIDGKRMMSWLVRPDVSSMKQVFDGSLSDDQAQKISGITKIIDHDEALVILKDATKRHSVVYALNDAPHAKYYEFVVNPAQKKLWKDLERTFNDVHDCRLQLAKLRAIKSPEEIQAIQKAIKVTADAFKDIKSKLGDMKYEYQLEAEFTHHFRWQGADGHAYDPIIASGPNATTLHYNENQSKLKSGTMILMDVGAKVDGYCADITRTYAYGAVSEKQRQLHSAVEQAHKAIINVLEPGLSVAMYHEKVDIIMKQALSDVGYDVSESDSTLYRTLFPHAISHGLGVDVHDSLGKPTVFLPGMILTVEPGIYDTQAGYGVRIEDDILITEKGHKNLSAALATGL